MARIRERFSRLHPVAHPANGLYARRPPPELLAEPDHLHVHRAFGHGLVESLYGVEYPLAFAFITAIADILPVLGPGVVYIPLAISFILYKNYLAGVTLIVFFLITVIIRQVIEPKIVSDGVKLHPLVVLSAIYFSIVSMNIWVLFYVVSIFLSFKVLDTAGAFDKSIDSSAKENKKVDIS